MSDHNSPKPDNKLANNLESPPPSHIMEGKYATFMETNGKDCESWYSFIRVEGNEAALKHLEDQLEQVEWDLIDDLSIFLIELQYLVSAQTAKEMTKIDMNAGGFHRKFDGKLDFINFKFKKKDSNDRMIEKAFDQLGEGRIEDFIGDEDIDDEDLTENPYSDSLSESDSESLSDSDKDKECKQPDLPKSLTNSTPKFTKKTKKTK